MVVEELLQWLSSYIKICCDIHKCPVSTIKAIQFYLQIGKQGHILESSNHCYWALPHYNSVLFLQLLPIGTAFHIFCIVLWKRNHKKSTCILLHKIKLAYSKDL